MYIEDSTTLTLPLALQNDGRPDAPKSKYISTAPRGFEIGI